MEYLLDRKKELIIISLSALLFLLIALDVYFDGLLVSIDGVIHQWSLGWHTPLWDRVFFEFTKLGNLSTMLLFTLAMTLYLLWKKERSKLVFYWSGMVGASLLFSGLKEIFARTRPSSYIGDFHQHGYSFPSGHATISMTFALLLLLLFYQKTSGAYRVLLVAFCILFPLLISFSRIYLGVHYFSDIAGGMILAVFWVTLMAYISTKVSPTTK